MKRKGKLQRYQEEYPGGFKIHSHERDDRTGNNYSPDGGDMYDLGWAVQILRGR